MRNRVFSILLLVAILASFLVMPASATNQEESHPNTYVNTGDQRMDILGVAQSQLGYEEGPGNDSKYGSWLGYPNLAWCASFIGWCAAQAGVSEEVMLRTSWVSVSSFGIPVYENINYYTPQPGDLFFKKYYNPDGIKEYSHVGFVWYVEGDYFYTIEGNSDVLGSTEGKYVISNKRLLAEYDFGAPQYRGESGHNYQTQYDEAHPHKEYKVCTDAGCDEKYYTGNTKLVPECKQCIQSHWSTEWAGYYRCVNVDVSLNIRKGPGTENKKIGGVLANDLVYVYATYGGWAYIEYEHIRGWASLNYLKSLDHPDIPLPTEPKPTTPPPTEPEPTDAPPTEPQPTDPPATEPGNTEPPATQPHEHTYGEGQDKHVHQCPCGEVYVADGACAVCGKEQKKWGLPWWIPWCIICVAEAVVIVLLLFLPRYDQKKKQKRKYTR